MLREVINIRTNANNTSGKKNDTQRNNHDCFIEKDQKRAKAEEMTTPNGGRNKKHQSPD